MKKSSFNWIIRGWIAAASLLAFAGGWVAFSHSNNPAASAAQAAAAPTPAVSAQTQARSNSNARIQQAPSSAQSFSMPRLRSRGS